MNTTWKVVCATLVIFIAGIVTGATLVRFAQAGPPRWRMQRPATDNRGQPNPPVAMNPGMPNQLLAPQGGGQGQGLLSREFIQVLERQLRLTPEQHAQISKIMNEGQERVRELRSRIDPELRKELQQTREQIRAALTPEQREQFEQLMKRSSRRPERGEGPGQPGRFHDSRNPPPMGAPHEGEPREAQPHPQPPGR